MSMTPWNLPHGQWSKNLTLATDTLAGICPVVNGQNVQGGPKVTSQRFELFAWPLIIGSAKFVQECAGTVTGSRNI